jgi:hypothetical protein
MFARTTMSWLFLDPDILLVGRALPHLPVQE